MTAKRIFGFIFLVIAVLLSLAIVGQLAQFLAAIIGFFQIFTGALDGHQTGYVLGTLFFWILHITITILLWVYGLRWIKSKKNKPSVQ
jgi:Na+/phosphate symporter